MRSQLTDRRTALSECACAYDNSTRSTADADKPRDAFRDQSRSPNMIPFDMLGMVSYYCAIVTLSLRDI